MVRSVKFVLCYKCELQTDNTHWWKHSQERAQQNITIAQWLLLYISLGVDNLNCFPFWYALIRVQPFVFQPKMLKQTYLMTIVHKSSEVHQKAELMAVNKLHLKYTKRMFHEDLHRWVYYPDGDRICSRWIWCSWCFDLMHPFSLSLLTIQNTLKDNIVVHPRCARSMSDDVSSHIFCLKSRFNECLTKVEHSSYRSFSTQCLFH